MAITPFEIIRLSCLNGELNNVQTYLLTENSEYLRRMIHDMRTETLTLHITREIAFQMLNFLEGLEIQLESIQNGIDMYTVGRRYQIIALEKYCRNFLIAMIDNENVCKLYEFGVEVNDQFIRFNCWTWIFTHAEDTLITNGFCRSKKSTVNCFVSRPRYRNLREVNLFKAIYAWAENKVAAVQRKSASKILSTETAVQPADIRREMNFVIRKIRFLSMEITELERDVFPKNILTLEEQQGVCDFFRDGVTDNFPLSICQITDDRGEDQREILVVYLYRNEVTDFSRPLSANDKFRAEFIVTECCFMPLIKLPITHQQEQIKVIVIIEIESNNDQEYPFIEERLLMQQDGTVLLNQPVFINKYSKVTVISSFDSIIISQIFLRENVFYCFHSLLLKGFYIDPVLYF